MAKIQGYLSLIGDDFRPDDVTAILQVQPHWVRTKYERLGNGQCFGHYEWGINTNIIEDLDLQPVENQLMEFIKPRTQLMAEVAKACCAEWNILFYISSAEVFPAAYLVADFIQMSAEINALIGFDVYINPTRQDEENAEDSIHI